MRGKPWKRAGAAVVAAFLLAHGVPWSVLGAGGPCGSHDDHECDRHHGPARPMRLPCHEGGAHAAKRAAPSLDAPVLRAQACRCLPGSTPAVEHRAVRTAPPEIAMFPVVLRFPIVAGVAGPERPDAPEPPPPRAA